MITSINEFKKINKSSVPTNESILASKKYTHFAIYKSTNKLLDAWDYKGYDKDELNSEKDHYFFNDIKDKYPDQNIKKSEVKILTKSALEKSGINPEDSSNWFGSPVNTLTEKYQFLDEIRGLGTIYFVNKNDIDEMTNYYKENNLEPEYFPNYGELRIRANNYTLYVSPYRDKLKVTVLDENYKIIAEEIR